MYVPLRLCGFAYKIFEHVLGVEQYYHPGSNAMPANRLFCPVSCPTNHRNETRDSKAIMLPKKHYTCCVCNSCYRHGCGHTRYSANYSCWPSMQHESILPGDWTCWRLDGKPSSASLYYNNHDIGKNRVNMQDDMRTFCASEHVGLRKLLLESLDFDYSICKEPLHLCCGVCKKTMRMP